MSFVVIGRSAAVARRGPNAAEISSSSIAMGMPLIMEAAGLSSPNCGRVIVVVLRVGAMRLLVADDHPLYREAVRLRLRRLLPDSEVVEAGTFDQILAIAREAPPRAFDLVLFDLHMAEFAPDAVVRTLMEALPETPLLLMSGTANAEEVKRAVAAGARGFLPKTMEADHFAAAISLVLGGGSYLPVEVLSQFDTRSTSATETAAPPLHDLNQRLTPRERQVLALVASGASNKEIARELTLAEVTVKLHLRQILRKIDARNRSEAAAIATKAGLI
jgi:two-component system, NarL family, nitrate/nitrite response regulator NarL